MKIVTSSKFNDLFFKDSATSQQIWEYINETYDMPPLVESSDEVFINDVGIIVSTDDELVMIDIKTITPIF
jgi:hypothetical protein